MTDPIQLGRSIIFTKLTRALLAMVALLLAACRAIAGINGDLTYASAVRDADVARDAMKDVARRGDAADAGPQDAGPDVGLPDANACPTASPEVVFELPDGGLGPILLSDASVYAEVVYPGNAGLTNAPYSGLVKCDKPRCAAPTTLADYSSPRAGVQWGGAAFAPAGLVVSLSSLSPDKADGHDSGVSQEAGSISYLAADGGVSSAVASLADPFLVATAANVVYWLDDPQWMSDEASRASWRVLRCALPCTSPEVFMQGVASESYGLYLDSANVYVFAQDPGASSGGSNIYTCPKDGGCPAVPTPFQSYLNSPLGAFIWPDDPLLGGDTLASDGMSVFWASQTNTQILKLIRDAPEPLALINLTLQPTSVAVDATYVYWSAGGGTIQRTRKDDAWRGVAQNVVCSPGQVSNIAVDETGAYYETVQGNATTVWRVPLPPDP